jgi:hypothetical protein
MMTAEPDSGLSVPNDLRGAMLHRRRCWTSGGYCASPAQSNYIPSTLP